MKRIASLFVSVNFIVGLAFVFWLYSVFNPYLLDDKNPAVTRMAGIAVLMAVLWMTEKIPLAVTALIPVALYPFLDIMSGKKVASVYFNHLIFLFIGGFLIALAMEKWNLHRRIALRILLLIGNTPSLILLGVMTVTAFLSMWISNTATTMMMVPIVLSLAVKWDREQTSGMTKALLLGTAYAASIGGVATLIGTPPNLFFARIYKIYFPQAPEIDFARWFSFAFPLSVVLLLAAYFYLRWTFLNKSQMPQDPSGTGKDILVKEYKELGPVQYEEKVVLILFIVLALLWLTRRGLNFGIFHIPRWDQLFGHPSWITDGNVAMLIGVLLFVIPAKNKSGGKFIMDWKTAERIPWNIILLFGGGFALAEGFKASGLTEYIGHQLAHLNGLNPLVFLLVTVASLTFLTELTSNTATVETLLPILASMAVFIKINPLFLMIPATVAASFAFMLPIATPPNAIVFASEKITIRDMMKAGLAMNIIGIIILTLMAYVLMDKVFDINPHVFPHWAELFHMKAS